MYEVVIPASQIMSLHISIMIFDKTELCLVNAQGMFWRKKIMLFAAKMN